MSIRAIAAALILAGMIAACTQKTCPTYTKDTVEQTEQSDQKV